MISVIIPALNSAGTIGRTLSSIFSGDLPNEAFEVIVVDNGSADSTVRVAQAFPIKILHCPIRGQGPARNLGLKEAKGDIICFTDSDTIVANTWLRRISEFFEENPDVDGIGGPVESARDGHANNLQKLEGEIYSASHDFPKEITQSAFGDKRTAPFSANSAFRKQALVSVNGFDSSAFDAVDIDLCWRLINKGKRLVFNPVIEVVHLGFAWNLQGIFRQQFRWGKSDVILKRRFPRKISLKEKLSPYAFFTKSFLCIPVSKRRDQQLLGFFEQVAFQFGRFLELAHPSKLGKRAATYSSIKH